MLNSNKPSPVVFKLLKRVTRIRKNPADQTVGNLLFNFTKKEFYVIKCAHIFFSYTSECKKKSKRCVIVSIKCRIYFAVILKSVKNDSHSLEFACFFRGLILIS